MSLHCIEEDHEPSYVHDLESVNTPSTLRSEPETPAHRMRSAEMTSENSPFSSPIRSVAFESEPLSPDRPSERVFQTPSLSVISMMPLFTSPQFSTSALPEVDFMQFLDEVAPKTDPDDLPSLESLSRLVILLLVRGLHISGSSTHRTEILCSNAGQVFFFFFFFFLKIKI